MTTTTSDPTNVRIADVLGTMRMAVGAGSWLAPGGAWRVFGVGHMQGHAGSGLATRLFGVRDLALGYGERHPDPAVRAAALRIGVAVDALDVVASIVAVRKGTPKTALLGVTAGAALFAVLGALAAQQEDGAARRAAG